MRVSLVRFSIIAVLAACCVSAENAPAGKAVEPSKAGAKTKAPPSKPTFADVHYGPHERNVLDFYQAHTDKPAPVMLYIHGGGWLNGDKSIFHKADPYLRAGISVVSISYRLIPQAEADKLVPPVIGPLHDAARALQFIRSKAEEWHIDKQRIGASGSSAGACSALWLAFHPDMADPQNADPVLRESTRLYCAAVVHPQTSLDPKQMIEWIPNIPYGAHAFGFKGDPAKNLTPFQEFLAKRDTILPWIAEYSPWALVTPDDPPIFMSYETPPAMGQFQPNTAHSANFGVKLQERCKEQGVECELACPGLPEPKHHDAGQYLIQMLKGRQGPSARS